MKRVVGIGGVFIKCQDKASQAAWYRRHLGIPAGDYGHSFLWRDEADPQSVGYTVWSTFPADTKYFQPSDAKAMINYRVDDLVALVSALTDEGVKLVGGIDDEENGKFAWILDPEGNKIELWQPIHDVFEKMAGDDTNH